MAIYIYTSCIHLRDTLSDYCVIITVLMSKLRTPTQEPAVWRPHALQPLHPRRRAGGGGRGRGDRVPHGPAALHLAPPRHQPGGETGCCNVRLMVPFVLDCFL